VTVAVLGRPRGNRGELTATGFSDHADRYSRLKTVYLVGPALSPDTRMWW